MNSVSCLLISLFVVSAVAETPEYSRNNYSDIELSPPSEWGHAYDTVNYDTTQNQDRSSNGNLNYDASKDRSTSYDSPSVVYGVPEQYGPPDRDNEVNDTTTTEVPTSTDDILVFDSKKTNKTHEEESGKLRDGKGTREQGVYYIYHPRGQLQRVAYVTAEDKEKMEYTAQLRYKNVEPIKDPVYTYDPDTYQLRILNV